MTPNLLIANPAYTPGFVSAVSQMRARDRHPEWVFHHFELVGSLLTWCFNSAWATALNLRAQGLTHFLMIHADIKPLGDDWLGILMQEMESARADVLSVVVPIKDQRGLTSTAIDTDLRRPRRLTTTQIATMAAKTRTFSAPGLLINTGLLLVDMREPWVEAVRFTMRDRIIKNGEGQWVADVEPEDWGFSRQCHAIGRRVFATTAVTVEHYGTGTWRSDVSWGWDHDEQNGGVALKVAAGA